MDQNSYLDRDHGGAHADRDGLLGSHFRGKSDDTESKMAAVYADGGYVPLAAYPLRMAMG